MTIISIRNNRGMGGAYEEIILLMAVIIISSIFVAGLLHSVNMQKETGKYHERVYEADTILSYAMSSPYITVDGARGEFGREQISNDTLEIMLENLTTELGVSVEIREVTTDCVFKAGQNSGSGEIISLRSAGCIINSDGTATPCIVTVEVWQ